MSTKGAHRAARKPKAVKGITGAVGRNWRLVMGISGLHVGDVILECANSKNEYEVIGTVDGKNNFGIKNKRL